jgi:tetratricopeptide (TPR) repeat protein
VSPRQRRWTCIGALVCLSALGAQRARAEEASRTPPGVPIRMDLGVAGTGPVGTTGPADAASVAGPLRLTRPLAPETLARVLAEAESLYRARQHDQARQAYATLVELDPLNAHAWLRLGNLHQLAGRDADALDAYRNASLTVPTTRADAEARGKALLNVALLHVAHASRAIDELDAMGLATLGEARGDVARQVGAQRHRANRAATRDFEGSRPARDAGDAPQAEPGGPYTVDRWTARARRPPTRRESPGRAAIVEPVLESAQPEPPVVEVLRGGRGAARP